MSADPTKENEVIKEFFDVLINDPNCPGNVITDSFPTDIEDVLEDLIYIRGFNNVLIHVRKEKDKETISFETVSRSTQDVRAQLSQIKEFVDGAQSALEKGDASLIDYLANANMVLVKIKK